MGIEALIGSLEEDAREKAASILREARSEAARIRREAQEEAARGMDRFLAGRERELREAVAAEVAEARRESRARILEARSELLDRVFRAAEERLPEAADSAAYRRGLPSRLAAALGYLEPEGARVRCPPTLEGAVGEALEASGYRVRAGPVAPGGGGEVGDGPDAASGPGRGVTVRIEAEPGAPPGFVAVQADGSVRVDDTLSRRMERAREILAMAVVERIEVDGRGARPDRGLPSRVATIGAGDRARRAPGGEGPGG